MMTKTMKYTIGATFLTTVAFAASPEGPSQQCTDDAGPPWGDDEEYFGSNAYSFGTPAAPLLSDDGSCPPPLQGACAEKGAQRAFLEGPVQCGNKGWFCRIIDQPGWKSEPDYGDQNFAHCNTTDADERSFDGHCHGSDTDNVYGWWARDHWFRGYAGTLHCCCDWDGLKGLVNQCDFRKFVPQSQLDSCRDANEEHEGGYEGTCGAYSDIRFEDPIYSGSDQCWTVYNFADPEAVPNPNPIVLAPSPSNPTPSNPTRQPTAPTRQPTAPTRTPDSPTRTPEDDLRPEEEEEEVPPQEEEEEDVPQEEEEDEEVPQEEEPDEEGEYDEEEEHDEQEEHDEEDDEEEHYEDDEGGHDGGCEWSDSTWDKIDRILTNTGRVGRYIRNELEMMAEDAEYDYIEDIIQDLDNGDIRYFREVMSEMSLSDAEEFISEWLH